MKNQISRTNYIVSIIILIIGILQLTSCTNKKDISQKVTEIYKGVTRNPMGDIISDMHSALQGTNFIEENSRMMEERMKSMNEFNDNTAKIIRNDPELEKYFNKLLKKMNNNDSLTIEKLNYYGVEIRELLENDLNVDILDNK